MVKNTTDYQSLSLRVNLLKAAVLVFFILAHWSTLLWLAQKSEQRADAMFIIVLLVVGLGFAWRKPKTGQDDFQVVKPALLLLLIVTGGGILNTMTIRFPQADVMLLILGIYGWLGLNKAWWLKWSKGLAIVLLLAIAIPFYLEFRSGLGFSLRLLTASVVKETLATMGISAISSHDIIMTENAIAHIDIPCSGLKGLWVGSLFFLIVLIIFNIRITWNVWWKYLAFVLLLLSANTGRVLILTLLTSIYSLPEMAKIFHIPLGILGFGISCGVVVLMLLHQQTDTSSPILTPATLSNRAATVLLLFIIFLTGWQAVAAIHETTLTTQPKIIPFSLPHQFQSQPVSLTTGEQQYFAQSTQTMAQKWRFVFANNPGSILLVQSSDSNMFHAPELCLVANGITVTEMKTVKITPSLQARILSLNHGQATGIYWLQSKNYTTDNFGERYWRYLWSKEKDWRMISLIIDKPYPIQSDTIANLTKLLYFELSRDTYETALIQ
jgi:exosortase O